MELRLNGVVMEDGHLLREYAPKDHDIIQVIDHDPNSPALNGWLDDVSLIQRYVMSDEDYDKRPNTYRMWKKKKLEEDPNWLPPWVRDQVDKAIAARAEQNIESIDRIKERFKVGDRCECSPGGRRGVIRYIGYAGGQPLIDNKGQSHQPQVYVGIQFDEPVGKNDGSHKDVRYFECGRNYGAFLKPDKVKVGDYPERDPFASDEEVESEAEDIMEEL